MASNSVPHKIALQDLACRRCSPNKPATELLKQWIDKCVYEWNRINGKVLNRMRALSTTSIKNSLMIEVRRLKRNLHETRAHAKRGCQPGDLQMVHNKRLTYY